jgi:hypothetical protein
MIFFPPFFLNFSPSYVLDFYFFLRSGLRDLTTAPACHISELRIAASSFSSFSR